MPSVMPSQHHSPHPHAQTAPSDLQLLDYLSSTPAAPKRKLARREQPLDPLLFTAVLAGSGQITRHHIGHGLAPAVTHPGSYASCDVSRPMTPSQKPNVQESAPAMTSQQAPRSERIRLEQEARARAGSVSEPIVISAPATGSTHKARGSSSAGAISTSPTKTSSRRRMSIDPLPISHVLQMASSPVSRTCHLPSPPPAASSSTKPAAATGLLPSPSGKLQVKCMARTRVPTPHGELFLHLYHNSTDHKEHLALVYDPIQLDPSVKALAPRGRREIRSRTLDAVWREGETEMERLVRGAYVGRLTSAGGQPSAPSPASGSQLPTPITEETDILDGLDPITAADHLATEPDIKPLVRIHSECYTGETIGSMRCDCGEQLDEALRQIAAPQAVTPSIRPSFTRSETQPPSPNASPAPTPEHTVPGRGVVVYMRQEGRGIGLLEKIRAYNLQDLGHDTVSANLLLGHGADERSYGVAAAILRDLGLGDVDRGDEGVRLLTNNPEKVEGMAAEHIGIVQRVGMVPRDWMCKHDGDEKSEKEYEEWKLRHSGVGLIGGGKTHGPELEKYLKTKVERMGHLIEIPQDRAAS